MNKTFFLENEGNNFFQRNKEAYLNKEYLENDIILKNLNFKKLKNLKILEIGCSSGWRLHKLQEMYSENNYYGIDPSIEAIDLGNNVINNNIKFNVGTCDEMNIYENNKFDIILVPFVFMYIDRELLFISIYEIDRILKNNGKLIITDFYSNRQRKNSYKYINNSFIYKQNFFEIFLSTKNYFLEKLENFTHNTSNQNDNYDDTCFYVELKKDLLNMFN